MELTLNSSTPFVRERRRAAVTLLVGAIGGAGTQALFWRTGVGLNFWVWDLCAVAACVLAFQRGPLRATAWGAMAASAVLGFSLVRYESGWTSTIAIPATLLMLAALPLLLTDRPGLAEISAVPGRVLGSLVKAPQAVVETSRLPGVALGGAPPGLLRGMGRGLLVGIPTAAVFTLLLASDTDFARSLLRVRGHLGSTTVFVGWSLLTAAAYLVTHTLHRAKGGSVTEARDERPYRALPSLAVVTSAVKRVSVSPVTWAMVVGQVALVFGIFVAANLRHLFGGNALVRAPGSLTYSRYLHAGLYAVLFATVLSVCLVLAGHALLERRDGEAGRIPGGIVLRGLEGSLLALTGITVASCWQRLGIYEDAYGASHLRLGVAFVEVGVLGVVLLTLGKVIARGWRGYGGAVLSFAALLAVVASGFNADAYVARTNLDRAAAGKPLDVAYLTSLSGDARRLLDHPYVAAHPELAARLDAAFCRPGPSSWRAFRGLGRCTR